MNAWVIPYTLPGEQFYAVLYSITIGIRFIVPCSFTLKPVVDATIRFLKGDSELGTPEDTDSRDGSPHGIDFHNAHRHHEVKTDMSTTETGVSSSV